MADAPSSSVPFHTGDCVRLRQEGKRGFVRFIERNAAGGHSGRYVVECPSECLLVHGSQLVLLSAAPMVLPKKMMAVLR